MKKPTVMVQVKCIGCGAKANVGPGDQVPMCVKCGLPMVATKTVRR